jgi:hypothetical protein
MRKVLIVMFATLDGVTEFLEKAWPEPAEARA